MPKDPDNTVVLDDRGLPIGFLSHVDTLRTISVDLSDDGILTITLNRP
jgi:hypothetical protein